MVMPYMITAGSLWTLGTRKELMVKSIAIKKKFNDCFYSANIIPLVLKRNDRMFTPISLQAKTKLFGRYIMADSQL